MNLRRRNRHVSEVYTASLNDIMFFLLLFFLICSTMVNPNVIKVPLPKADKNKLVSKKNVVVNIDEAGIFYVNKNRTDLAHLPDNLLLALNGDKDPVIQINAYKLATWDNVVQVMAIAQKLKAKILVNTEVADSE